MGARRPGHPGHEHPRVPHLTKDPRAPRPSHGRHGAGDVQGSHPDPEAACDHLAGTTDPFAPLGADVVCTEQFGGPQTARVTGRWDGRPVDLELSRSDGCRIAQWDALVPLVPEAQG